MIEAVSKPNTAILTATKPKSIRWPWAYDAAIAKRDLRLDYLRGICFFVMTINHISDFAPTSWINAATGHGDFFITAAEGFVFISGLVMGIVYSAIVIKQGLGPAVIKALQRLVKIYYVTVGMTLFFVAIATFTPLNLWAKREWITIKDPIQLIISSFTMHFAFHGSSIMVMFVLFLLLPPGAFYLFTQGKAWLVVALSWGVWAINLFFPNEFSIPFQSNFPYPAWQAIFMTGVVIGYYRKQITEFFSPRWRTIYYVAVVVLSVLLFAFYVLDRTGLAKHTFLANINYAGEMQAAEDKGNLPIERMFPIFLYLQMFFLLVDWFWVPLQKSFGWFFLTLGEAGMYAFIMHFAVIIIFYNIPGLTSLPDLWYGFAQIGATVLLWVFVKTHFLYAIIPR